MSLEPETRMSQVLSTIELTHRRGWLARLVQILDQLVCIQIGPNPSKRKRYTRWHRTLCNQTI
jgi:hypothetical protein